MDVVSTIIAAQAKFQAQRDATANELARLDVILAQLTAGAVEAKAGSLTTPTADGLFKLFMQK